jgi:hypothetical protein
MLSYIRTRTHNDSWIPDNNHICMFHSVFDVPSRIFISPICCLQGMFPFKFNNDRFPNSTADI